MTKKIVSFLVSGDVVKVVSATVPQDPAKPITIQSDDSWHLQKGDRGQALAVMHQRCSDYLTENPCDMVLVKASAVAGSAGLSLLTSAEVRGVVIAAAASKAKKLDIVSKAVISRTYGTRKVDEYVKDDAFWDAQTTGAALRKSSREAAMLIIAKRNS